MDGGLVIKREFVIFFFILPCGIQVVLKRMKDMIILVAQQVRSCEEGQKSPILTLTLTPCGARRPRRLCEDLGEAFRLFFAFFGGKHIRCVCLFCGGRQILWCPLFAHKATGKKGGLFSKTQHLTLTLSWTGGARTIFPPPEPPPIHSHNNLILT
ncbi:unnamed protein product, partial [Discosporangium mesarthrocarpum]